MNIQERRNREGKITSYRIRVYDHRDALTGKQYFRTVSVKYVAGKSEAWNRRNAEKEAVLFEKKHRRPQQKRLAQKLCGLLQLRHCRKRTVRDCVVYGAHIQDITETDLSLSGAHTYGQAYASCYQ